MNNPINFIVNYKGQSELIKATKGISLEELWTRIIAIFELGATNAFLYALPNDFSNPIALTTEVFNSLMNYTSGLGPNHVIQLKILTPESFVFEVNPFHLGHNQTNTLQKDDPKRIGVPKYKQIKNEVEGFYFENKLETDSQFAGDDEPDGVSFKSFADTYLSTEKTNGQISLNTEPATFELKDSNGKNHYAARIQIANTGSNKLFAMRWHLKQIFAPKNRMKSYPLPDLEAGGTYDLIFNLNLRVDTKEVSTWALAFIDDEGEERFFGDVLKAQLDQGHPRVEVVKAADVPNYITSFPG